MSHNLINPVILTLSAAKGKNLNARHSEERTPQSLS